MTEKEAAGEKDRTTEGDVPWNGASPAPKGSKMKEAVHLMERLPQKRLQMKETVHLMERFLHLEGKQECEDA